MIHNWRLDYIGLLKIVEFLKIDWLQKFTLEKVDFHTEVSENVFEHVTELSERLLREGLNHPGVIEISLETLNSRLIFGNHRLSAFKNLGFEKFPVYVSVVDRFKIRPEEKGISFPLKPVYAKSGITLYKPSEIFDVG